MGENRPLLAKIHFQMSAFLVFELAPLLFQPPLQFRAGLNLVFALLIACVNLMLVGTGALVFEMLR